MIYVYITWFDIYVYDYWFMYVNVYVKIWSMCILFVNVMALLPAQCTCVKYIRTDHYRMCNIYVLVTIVYLKLIDSNHIFEISLMKVIKYILVCITMQSVFLCLWNFWEKGTVYAVYLYRSLKHIHTFISNHNHNSRICLLL